MISDRCAAQGNYTAVRLFLSAGINPYAKNKEGRTAMMLATLKGNTEIAQVLLKKGAEVNAKEDMALPH